MFIHVFLQLFSTLKYFIALGVTAPEALFVSQLDNFTSDCAAKRALLFVIHIALVAQVVQTGLYTNSYLNWKLAFGTYFGDLIVTSWVDLSHV